MSQRYLSCKQPTSSLWLSLNFHLSIAGDFGKPFCKQTSRLHGLWAEGVERTNRLSGPGQVVGLDRLKKLISKLSL